MKTLEDVVKTLRASKGDTVRVKQATLLKILTGLLKAQHEIITYELESLFEKRKR